jgi:hypothetical protein
MLVHTSIILLLILLILHFLEYGSLVSSFSDSLFGILATSFLSEFGASGDEPGLLHYVQGES